MQELPDIGDEFAGYLLRSVIGRGAMSLVYEAEHPRLGHDIALKVLAAEVAADGIFRRRFLEESRIAAAMGNPHVIPVYDVGESDGLLYIAMHRVADGSLRQKIAKDGPLEPAAAVSLLGQAAQALDAAHRTGLVHRDVKPENLLIEAGDDAGAEHLYLADFGISRLGMERNGLTSTGQFLGTTDYVAPEQVTEPYVYGSADQYSLGCVLYECLTGQLPFEQDAATATAAAVRPAPRADLPPAVVAVFARVLAERPGDRYNTCREFMEAAGRALAEAGPAEIVTAHTPASAPVDHQPEAASEVLQVPEAPEVPEPPEVPEAPEAPAPKVAVPTAAQRRWNAAPEPTIADSWPATAATASVFERVVPAPTASTSSAASTPPTAPPAPADPGPGNGRHRARWLVIAAVVLLICAGGGGAYAALSSHPKAAAMATPTTTPMATKSAMPPRAKVSLLTQVLTAANESRVAKGMLPPSSCAQGATVVTCTKPTPAIARVTFTTYPSLKALYVAYEAEVRSLRHGRFRANVQNCGMSAPSPYGEIAWNHMEQHSRVYTVRQMIDGKVSVETAMGRMACIAAGHSEDIVWTTDYGKLLGVAIGSESHSHVWLWWTAVHHNIVFPGTPMNMGDSSVSLMKGAPMPSGSASPSPSMMTRSSPMATSSPAMPSTAAPSMSK